MYIIQCTCANSRGEGERGLFLCSKNGNSGEEGGLCEIPSLVGVWILYFLEVHMELLSTAKTIFG